DPVCPRFFHLFPSALNKRILIQGNGKPEDIPLPFPGAAIFQVFRIQGMALLEDGYRLTAYRRA
ncbi:MAG: hypothetical protein ACXVKR_18675, partial [Flavisolibacter sp.]